MNENYINENNIDSEHRIESVINDCKVTIYFSKTEIYRLREMFSKIFWIHLRTE